MLMKTMLAPAVALLAAVLLIVAPTTAQADEAGVGCYCSGYECIVLFGQGEPRKWCCAPWPSSNCGCTLAYVNCIDNVE